MIKKRSETDISCPGLSLRDQSVPLDAVSRIKKYFLVRCAWRDPNEIPLFLPKSVALTDLVHPLH